jgi:hypothetical protein
MSNTTKCAEIIYLGFLVVQGFIRSSALQTFGRCTIQQMNSSGDCFSLELPRHLLVFQQTSCHLHNSTVATFNHAILLWCIGSSGEMLDAMLITKLFEHNGIELTSTILAKCSELSTTFSFCQCLDSLETLKCLIFCCQEFNPHVAAVVINHKQKVALTP